MTCLMTSHADGRRNQHDTNAGVVVYRLEVDSNMTNGMGTMHGGAISTLLDEVTTMPVILKDPDCRPVRSPSPPDLNLDLDLFCVLQGH